jgi:hypothetical protein
VDRGATFIWPDGEPNPGPGGIYARLKEARHTLDHFDEEVRSRMPMPDEARALRLAPRRPGIPPHPHRLRHPRPPLRSATPS